MIYYIQSKDLLRRRTLTSIVITMSSQKKAIEKHLENFKNPDSFTPDEYFEHDVKEISKKDMERLHLTVPLIYSKEGIEYHELSFGDTTVDSKINFETHGSDG